MTTEPDVLKVATRAYAIRAKTKKKKKKKKNYEPSPQGSLTKRGTTPKAKVSLVFDTETTTDVGQQLNFGCCRIFVDRPGGKPGSRCAIEVLFYADNLPCRDPTGFEILKRYVESHSAQVAPGCSPEILLMSRTHFVEEFIYKYGYRNMATIVGFNLPFDLSRLAISARSARGFLRGGNSLRLWEREHYRPRIAYKPIDSKRALIQFTEPDEG